MSNVALVHVDRVFPDGVPALGDVNLEVAAGEYFVVVGPSGSGKTTLLRLIAGLDTPTAGDVLIGGKSMAKIPPFARELAMVFQSAALYPHLNVRRNLAFGLARVGVASREIDARVSDVAEMLSISALLDRRPTELSGGERKRVAIGRAICRRPRVLLLDEPLSDLDAPLRAELRWEFKRTCGDLGITVLHVTHDQSEALALGDRLCVVRDGRVQQVAAPSEVYDRPANAFVARFFGNPGMNLLRGELRDNAFYLSESDQAIRYDQSATESDAATRIGDGPAYFGVRPEHMSCHGGGTSLPPVVVRQVEHLGHETIARFQLAGELHAVRRPHSSAIRPGDTLNLSIADGKWQLFSAGDDERLL